METDEETKEKTRINDSRFSYGNRYMLMHKSLLYPQYLLTQYAYMLRRRRQASPLGNLTL